MSREFYLLHIAAFFQWDGLRKVSEVCLYAGYGVCNFSLDSWSKEANYMDHPLINKLYDAFNAHDLKAAVALLHPDVVWPSGAEGDYIEGRDAVAEYWERQWKLTDAHMEPQQVTTDDTGRLVVDVHQIVHDLSGHPLWDDTVQHVYQIENDLIRSMEIKNEQPEPVDDTYSPL